jgi:glycosyltransferase involved in cell wall biosynthesis
MGYKFQNIAQIAADMNAPRLLRITTVPVSLKLLLRGQLSYMKRHGFEVLAVSADGPEIKDLSNEGISHIIVPMTRRITLFQDLLCVIKLVQIIRNFQPDIIHTHTPKAGLLGMLAGWLCRVKTRMHTVAGLPLMEAKGFKRWVLIGTERLTYACAHRVYPNSHGLYAYMTETLRIKNSEKIKVIGKGSSNGIDTEFFQPTASLKSEADELRKKYGVRPEDVVFSFVGRIVKDKGIGELVSAFRSVEEKYRSRRKTFLFLIGDFEEELDPLDPADRLFLKQDPHVILAGFQQDVRPWIMASDIFVFPSYREGFPNVVMQACCLERACIVSDINGCNEIIRHGKTGILVKPKDTAELLDAMLALAEDADIRMRYSTEARDYVVKNFDQRNIWNSLLTEYKSPCGSAFSTPGKSQVPAIESQLRSDDNLRSSK